MKKTEGARMICQDCQVEIHCEKIVFQGEERLSWRNADGSAHYSIEENRLVHTPTMRTKYDVELMEVKDRLERIEKELGIVRVE